MFSTINTSGLIIYIIADSFCILMMIPILSHLIKSVGSETEIKTFRAMIWSFTFYTVLDMAMLCFTNGTAIPRFPIWLANIITVADEFAIMFVGYFWFRFGCARLNYQYSETKWFAVITAIPLCIIAVFSATSPFTGSFFRITSAGIYDRGPLFLLQAGSTMLYNLSIPVLSLISIIRTKSAAERKKAASLIKFVIAPMSTGLVQMLNPNSPIMCMGMVLGIYFVYIDLLDLQIYNDSLTGLNNRRRAEIFLSDCITTASPEHPFYVYMIDVDYFKTINDKYGHMEGDHALRVVADAIKKTADQNRGFAARIGGDEFILSIFNSKDIDPEKISGVLKQNLDEMVQSRSLPYTLQLSDGYVKCDSSRARFTALLSEADQKLYERKEENHKREQK